MDRELAHKAEDEGADIRYGERVDGSFHSSNVIGADGPLSSVASHFGFPRIKRFASTLQAIMPYRSEEHDMVEVFLSNSMFPGFFGWIIPQDEYTAEFGVGVETGDVQSAWKALLKLKKLEDSVKPNGAIIPLRMRDKTSMRNRSWNVILAGDAAGQVKATTGGGVVFGGNCAALAGKFATNPLRYEMEWRARFWPDLTFHGMVHRFFAKSPDESLSSLGKTFKKLNIDVYLSDYGHMDRPIRMLRPQLLTHIFRNVIS
jgi:flavin-dependent dehydrogenase